ncbi:MAG: hypothetical protein J7M26_07600 [Armatimonadetes bacterium]|nr:hypothetical protein [Armatimonadota bacterium]
MDVSGRSEAVKVGDKILLMPPRICTCINLHEYLWVHRQGRVEDVWRIAARGTVN